jgi:hypothetical protein
LGKRTANTKAGNDQTPNFFTNDPGVGDAALWPGKTGKPGKELALKLDLFYNNMRSQIVTSCIFQSYGSGAYPSAGFILFSGDIGISQYMPERKQLLINSLRNSLPERLSFKWNSFPKSEYSRRPPASRPASGCRSRGKARRPHPRTPASDAA